MSTATSIGSTVSSITNNLKYENEDSSVKPKNDQQVENETLSGPVSDSSNPTYSITAMTQNISLAENDRNFYSENGDSSKNFEIPIVGYEIMEERARFTVYKLRIDNKETEEFWFVFRRYTDFVRLCNRIKNDYPNIASYLPRKRWLKNNFDPIFLEERVSGLQTLINAILNVPSLLVLQDVQDFFCLNDSPVNIDTNEESRVLLESLEETINELRQQLCEKEKAVDSLQENLHSALIENEHFKKIIRNSTMNCQKCQKDYENLNKLLH